MRGSAVVVGAGIGGLAAARALLLAGWRVQVRERSDAPTTGGTALGMWPQAMAAIDRLDLGDAVRLRSAAQRGGQILRPDGAVLARVGGRGSVHLVSRGDLLATLADSLPDGAIRWGHPVRGPADVPEADLVVAADGIHSVFRPAGPRPLGTVAFRGTVPGTVSTVTETWGRGRLFGITPNGDGAINWFACVRAERVPTDRSPGTTAAALRELFDGWHDGVAAVVDAVDPAGVDRRRLSDLPPLATYVRGRVALLGDAAHAMAPNLGRGACETLLDAVALADALTVGQDVDEGLRRYDRDRRPPTRRLVRLARVVNRVSTAEGGAGPRDLALRGLLTVTPGRRRATDESTVRDPH
ncbi:FAD-dependent monooxygenase [Cellulomonas fengjieae]|uniref:FAD-dependent monooxygenase n=1 Tax=Cellulomonas fengjieae TaxID=2819978 RepID=UPI001AB01802|nr:FAD-dependent monooxygenase [Cellulomonas fengjieae]MBO3102552.1 FAD-dependent monooxygenase [Cellulomonas fengjieae]